MKILYRNFIFSFNSCNSPDAFKYPCFPMRFTPGGSRCTPFIRDRAICQLAPPDRRTTRDQANTLTSFVDGYGNTKRRADLLRRLDGEGPYRDYVF